MIPEGVPSPYCIILGHFQLDQVSIFQELTFNSQCLPCSAPSLSDQPPFTSVKQFTNSLLISTNLAKSSTVAISQVVLLLCCEFGGSSTTAG